MSELLNRLSFRLIDDHYDGIETMLRRCGVQDDRRGKCGCTLVGFDGPDVEHWRNRILEMGLVAVDAVESRVIVHGATESKVKVTAFAACRDHRLQALAAKERAAEGSEK